MRVLGSLSGEGLRSLPVIAGIFIGWVIVMGIGFVLNAPGFHDSTGLVTILTSALVFAAWVVVAIRVWRITHHRP